VMTLDACTGILVALVASRLLQASVWELEKTSLGRLVAILRRFPTAMAREAESPRDEYDVQRILWTMLAGIYPDLRDEQWLAQFGVYQPRADLGIETMKTIIEAKFIHNVSDFRNVQEGLVSDGTTYTQKPERFDKVIAVVYDDTSSQHRYDELREALKRAKGIIEVIIIPKVTPRPTMRRKSRRPLKKSRARK